MAIFDIPAWVKPHLFAGKNFDDLTAGEIAGLRERLVHFNHAKPAVSIMIPAWNEQDNLYRALSSLAANITERTVEIVVINNNSTDRTQELLDALGVRNYLQLVQGTPHARQMGLFKARGRYHLCADSDTYYPPTWIEAMLKPMLQNENILGVYGRYSFIPPPGHNRLSLIPYEMLTGIIIRIRRRKREFINMLGFNMGFVTEAGRTTGGFEVSQVRKFDNALGSEYFVDEAEDGRMALNLQKKGRIKMVTVKEARVFTSSRRLQAEGGLLQSFKNRFIIHGGRIKEYISGKK